MNKRNSKKSGNKSAFRSNSAINKGISNKARARARQMLSNLDEIQRRRGSMPDMHKQLVEKIRDEKSLRAVGRMALSSGAMALAGHSADALTALSPHLWEVVASKLVTNLDKPFSSAPSSPGFKPTSVEELVHPPVQRNLVENKTYYSKLEVREGEPSRMMRAAKKMYPSSSHDFWSTGSDYCSDMIYQCHGINQTGFWMPYTKAGGESNAPTVYNQVNKFTITSKDLYKFIQNSLTSTELTAANSMKENEDLLFNVESLTSKMVVRNASELTPCVCTAYLLNTKTLSAEGAYPVKVSTGETDFPSGYITDRTTRDLHSYVNSTGTDKTTISMDVAARLGFTPQMSPRFNDIWNVVDVIKSPVLNPGDQWNFTFKHYLAHSTSYQRLNEMYGDSPNFNLGQYATGDYEILLQYQGAPGFANNVHTAAHNVRFSTNSNPCMIACTQSRTIQYRFADSIGSTIRESDRFVSDVVRELDTSPRVSPYFGSGNYQFRAVAMTQTESRTANKEGIGKPLDDEE